VQGILVFLPDSLINSIYSYSVLGLCEIGAELFITSLLILGLYMRRNNIIRVYFGELTLGQCILFCIALLTANYLDVWLMNFNYTNFMLVLLSKANVIIISLLMIQLMIERERDVRKSKVIDIMDEQMHKATDYYNEVIELEAQTKKFRHDIKNLLLSLRFLIEKDKNEEALEYLDNMNALCKNTTNKYDTGNFVADMLISAKSTVAENIDTDILFEGYIVNEIANVDMVILLSNILDNAIEACEQINGKKTITIKSYLEKHLWVMTVENPTKKDVKIIKNHIDTTKDDKQIHGFGIQNIQRVVKKYNGSLVLDCKKGVFSVKAMLQVQ
jgi:sensor histidine kinase YesM